MGKPISLNLLRYGGIAVYLYSFFLHASYFQRPRLVNNPGPGLFIKNADAPYIFPETKIFVLILEPHLHFIPYGRADLAESPSLWRNRGIFIQLLPPCLVSSATSTCEQPTGPGLFIKNEPLTPLDLKFEKEGGNLGGILI